MMATKKSKDPTTPSAQPKPALAADPAATKPPTKAATKKAAPAAKKAAPAAEKAAPAAKKTARQAAAPHSPDLIARAAYLNYRRRVEQGLPGDSHGDWLEAERYVSGKSES